MNLPKCSFPTEIRPCCISGHLYPETAVGSGPTMGRYDVAPRAHKAKSYSTISGAWSLNRRSL
jgi:hypothetical protein